MLLHLLVFLSMLCTCDVHLGCTLAKLAAISAYEKSGQWQQALELFGRMPGEGVWRDTITYSAAISACENGGQWQQTLELFERMLGEGVQQNTYIYGRQRRL